MNGILVTDISDHFPIYTITKHVTQKSKPQTKVIRVISETNIRKFKEKLQNTDWDPVLTTRDQARLKAKRFIGSRHASPIIVDVSLTSVSLTMMPTYQTD